MVIENILQHEILNLNKYIIKKRVCIKDLLENPEICEGNKKIPVEKKCLEEIVNNTNIPLSEIFLPITFFIPAGSYEGYLTSQKDVAVVRALGYEMYHRNEKFWIPKYKIRKLEIECRGLFQSVILP